jgi:hypothetical protein
MKINYGKVPDCYLWLISTLGLVISKACCAIAFSIVPNVDLPTTVPQFGNTSAYYTVTNTTAANLNANFLKSLPQNVTQVTCDPNYCGATFNLGATGSASESCILKLTIKGPVNSNNSPPLVVCNQNESICDATTSTLNVTESTPVPFIGIGSGRYITDNGFFPLVATTNDSGATWDYPRALLDNLQQNIDPNFTSGLLRAAACSGSQNKSVCIAPGSFCNDSDCFSQLPLIAIGRRDNSFWVYPGSVFTDLQTKIDPHFTRGFLTGASCTGSGNKAFCIASGVYTTPSLQSPLLALSSNGGGSWSYPTSIFQNPQTTIDPNYTGGFLLSASCNKSTCDSVCVSTGAFSTATMQLPLVAVSTDKGQNWVYPPSVFQNLKSLIDPNFSSGELVSSSCAGTGNKTICIGAGIFFNNTTTQPLLALTRNGGATWTYPASIFTNLPVQIDPNAEGAAFNAASCTGKENTARCIAAGYFIKSGVNVPLIALTKDGGQNWSYPRFIYTKLKTLVNPNFRTGKFNGATCYEKATDSICMAAGDFCIDRSCSRMFPLIGVTKDGGKTWTYPSSVFENLNLKIDPNLTAATFNDISCSGIKEHSFCIATGEYGSAEGTFPLAAYSTDNGITWTYPPYIFKNLMTTISPEFKLGFFSKAATTGGKLNTHNLEKRLCRNKKSCLIKLHDFRMGHSD